MKKVLLASTALVAMSGAAMAEMSISGSAEMGIAGGSAIETQFHTDVDVTFSGSGTTDSGLTFGMSIDLDETDDSGAGGGPVFEGAFAQGGETIFISGSFGTITMGDTDGAYDAALKEAIIGGSLGDDHEHAGYDGNAGLDGTHDGQIARWDYNFGDFGVHASVEIDDTGAADEVLGLGFTGSFGDIGFGLGFQDDGTNDLVGVSVDATFGDIQVIANFTDGWQRGITTAADDSHIGLAVGYTSGPLLVAVNWGDYDDADESGVGLVVNYDLGGGAEVQFGYGDSDVAGVGTDTWSLGVAMSF